MHHFSAVAFMIHAILNRNHKMPGEHEAERIWCTPSEVCPRRQVVSYRATRACEVAGSYWDSEGGLKHVKLK